MTEQKERPNLYGVPTSAGAMMTKDPEPDWCHSGWSVNYRSGNGFPFYLAPIYCRREMT